ncbi:hypothetical protein [Microcoleus anatoxicus]|uniref:hypothetical protein n=1 Tax=Microcoleus anatoxicus TaxID=2705319 RepID=UPI0030C9282A
MEGLIEKNCDRPHLQDKLQVGRSIPRIYDAVVEKMGESAGGDRSFLRKFLLNL